MAENKSLEETADPEEEEAMEEENNEEEASESDTDSSGDDEETDKAIEDLESRITNSPYQYDLHIRLIALLRKEGELDKLRKARERMRGYFPLTGELWLAWIQDELKLISDESDKNKIIELFDRAVKDYMVPDVWLEYAQFCIGGIGTPDGIAQARSIFERAITAVGLHVAKGSAVWEVYREFENALLDTMQPPLGGIVTSDKEKELKSQTDRIATIFRRQLSIPLLDMEQTYGEYEQWMSDPIPGYVKQSYQKALDKLKKYIPFEEKLLAAKPPRLSQYQSYIDFETTEGDPVRIQCIYERAISENCLVSDLWINFTNYLTDQLKIKSVVLSVSERAVRNCPWSLILWEGLLRAQEKYEEEHNTIKDTFERALLGGFTQGTEYFELWQTYLDYLRRRIDDQKDSDTEENKALQEFRITIERAVDYLLQYFGAEADPTCSLQRYWARIEAKHSKSMEKARGIWNDVMASGYGNQAQMWLEYYNLERTFGDNKHCRKILHRAVNSASDWPESVCDALVNFEREEGTLETWESAMRRVDAQLKRVNEQRAMAAEKEAEANKHLEEKKKPPRSERKSGKKYQGEDTSEMQQMLSRRLQAAKKRKFEEAGYPAPDSTKDDSSSIAKKAATFKVPFVPASKPGVSPSKKPKVEESQDQPMEEEAEEKSSKVKVGHDASKDHLTVFVKNLNYHIKEETIRKIFAECGEITEVRMVTNHSKQFRGFCYVEFTDKESVDKALVLDKQPIEGRPMYVDPSRDTRTTPAPKKFQFSNELEKNKLFVSGLPRSSTKSDLHRLFGKYGEIKDIRIVTYKNGTPKGLAFVEYVNESDAAKAIMGTDGTQMGEHTVNVAISNPPKRRAKQGTDEPMETSATATAQESSKPRLAPRVLGAKGVTGPRGKGRTQLSMVPRALKRSAAPSTAKPKPQTQTVPAADDKSAADDGSGDQKPIKKLTNADFAKMLLKK
ncbi:LOW QUALITY PROTEIN: squamous cell carcinoma antigen recognized by T-cells 3-like [Amphiura filiformis]|uniref:LOW QUALITY PROTEIN: squamous cell carcinoma antigen recognized by T-cells 3-like n=1 Tax=Amphiura filiformis TaxID=82378 RepID=UPI003B21B4B3